MFQFRRFPSYPYFIQDMIPFGGFPHSDISGSLLICSSPKLFAAYRVLHRLLMPRHSPCALSLLDLRRNQLPLLPPPDLIIDSPLVLYYFELCRLMFQKIFFAKIVLLP